MLKRGGNDQIATKFTKGYKLHRPNGHEIFKHFPFQGPTKYTQVGIFWYANMYTIWQPCPPLVLLQQLLLMMIKCE
jgi:hypothetical protein